jgi:prepilin-type N-terminal cleavage/methylation domain-containing protein
MRSPSIFSRRAFTLIELLVVIAILAILMSMLFPAVSKALDNAKRTQAKNDVTQIAAAISAYQNEYGKLPIPGGASGDVTNQDGAVYDILSGADTNNNPRAIVFLAAPRSASQKNGRMNGTGPYYDPWGNQPYHVAMDGDYNNSLQNPEGGSTPTIQASVLVWSTGNPKYKSTDPSNPTKNWVKSWQ